jgi:hypothetical protein
MRENAIKQFKQFFRMFSAIVKDYDNSAWVESGHGLTKPYKLAYHIMQSIKFYTADKTSFILENGEEIKFDHKLSEKETITKADIKKNISFLKKSVEIWLKNLDFNGSNKDAPFTGKDMESVVLFLTQHCYFHLGELNALLNEYKKGSATDHFANNIY